MRPIKKWSSSDRGAGHNKGGKPYQERIIFDLSSRTIY